MPQRELRHVVERIEKQPMAKFIPFILFTVFTNAAAQLMLKYGMIQLSPISFAGVNPIVKILQIVFSPWVFFGLATFVVSMASHLFVLSKVELSYAYPFLSLAYVVVAVFAYLIFKEDLNAMRVGGIAFICLGTVFIAQGGSKLNGEDKVADLTPPTHHEVSR